MIFRCIPISKKQDGCSSKEQPSQSVKEPLISRAARRSRQPVLGAVCKKESTIFSDGAFLERATRLELASRHPTNGHCHSREPCLTSYDFTRCAQVEAASSRGCLQKRKHHLRGVQLRKHSKAREKRYSFGYAVSFIFACYQILWTFPKSRYLCSRYLPLACG